MEGQYYYNQGELNNSIRDKIRNQKRELRICSLSKNRNNELMWSHYADGQTGVAIGVRVIGSQDSIKSLQYDGIAFLENNNYHNDTATEILCHKLEVWSYEEEKRVFTENTQFVDVEIKEIVTGRRMSTRDISLITELIEKINPEINIIRANDIM